MSIGNQQFLQRYAKPIFISSVTDDKNTPFSFKVWYDSHQGIIPGQEFKQYNDYLINWYKDKSKETADANLQLKLNYLTLLRQLQLFFTQEEAENWYNKVNINDEKELLLAIPYFAKKLKDISLYYLQLREAIKESRLKYNQVGTNDGIVEQIQKFLLTSYTQKPNSSIAIPSSIWKNVPTLSSVRDTITVQIEELYDDHNYFDHSPTVPISSYYNITDAETIKFLSTKNLFLTSTEWIYKLGVHPLSADYLDITGTDLTELSKLISEKYLGANKFTSQVPEISTQKDFYTLDIISGNNFFYWPNSVYPSKAESYPRYEPVSIHDLNLETTATANSSIEAADTLFVKTTQGIKGAWLRNELYDYKNLTMNSILNPQTKTRFRFPFPGFGLSAEGIEWTGFGLNTDARFLYLDKNLKKTIEDVYWSTNIELSVVKEVKINDTALVDSKAYPSTDYNQADKIKVWATTPSYNSSTYSDIAQEAWLYKMAKTDISIKPNSNTVIYWPFEQLNTENDFPNYYPENISNFCQPLPVSSINVPFAIAGNVLSAADIIYKIRNYQNSSEDAYECCWLSGSFGNFPQNKITFTQQAGLQGIFNSGAYTKFIWNGPDNTDVETVFKSNKHQPDCKYLTAPNTTYLDFNTCTCKQVLFTPFGHPGSQYTDNNSFTDFIIEDNFSPNALDLSIWKDSSNTAYTESSAFCWYKTDSKIGWGYGKWYSGNSKQDNKFYLQKGKAYTYYRVEAQKQNLETVILPELVLRYDYNNANNCVWVRAIKNDDNTWSSANTPSPMIINPGDILLYTRAGSTYYDLTGTITEIVDISENRGSVWTDLDYITISQDKQIVLGYPSQTFLAGSGPAGQLPRIGINNLLSVQQWSISGTNQPIIYFRNTPSVLFTPLCAGLYTFGVTAVSATVLGLQSYSAATSGFYIFNNIPALTAVSPITQVPTLTSYTVPAPGYVLNTPLFGWDYNTSTTNPFANVQNKGARPYWGKTYLEKDETTGYKSILSWGTPLRLVDSYNFISQPEISDIVLSTGTYLEYERKYPSRLTWVQPIQLRVTIDKNQWCTLEHNITSESNFSYFLNNYKNQLVAVPTTSASDIEIQNFVDNKPVEIYYNAINPFTWSITATPEIAQTFYQPTSTTLAIEAVAPWTNLSNQFYPTVAAVPTLETLYSLKESGGYFTPSNLGVSIYLDKDYVTTQSISSETLLEFFENVEQRVGGRGFTKQEQLTPYIDVTENNIWLKEPTIAGPIAGTIKKDIFKKYQKFIPYQSAYESNPRNKIGLLNPTSRQTPWTGKEDSEWGDLQNYPVSYTGELLVSNWADAQVLKQTGLQIDNWCTDVFGNQYGLYKNIKDVSHVNRKYIPGEIWVRKNSQFVSPASKELVGVYDSYLQTSFYDELTGIGIRKIDIFFDTLLMELSGVLLFEKLSYDYDTDTIFSLADEARQLSLALPVTKSITRELTSQNMNQYNFALAGETWFFPNEKLVTQSICSLQNNIVSLELYQLDLNTQNFKKIFPINNEDILTINSLSSLSLTGINPCTLSYNTLKKEYVASVLGTTGQNKSTVIEFKITDLPVLTLDTITVYNPIPETAVQEPPIITQDLFVTLYTTPSSYTDVLNFQCITQNGPATFTATSLPSWVGLTPSGLFTGTPPRQTANYNATFVATNAVGPTYYNLNINVLLIIPPEINYILLEDESGFLIDDDGGRFIE